MIGLMWNKIQMSFTRKPYATPFGAATFTEVFSYCICTTRLNWKGRFCDLL